jgi:hypothetical protein
MPGGYPTPPKMLGKQGRHNSFRRETKSGYFRPALPVTPQKLTLRDLVVRS